MPAETTSTKAAAMLRERILSGALRPGDRLPSERRLSDQLGISRSPLRDALRTLEATGLIEAQIGRGWFVTDDQSIDRSASSAMGWLSLHRHDLESLNEVRGLLEPRAVETIPTDRLETVATLAEETVERQADAVRRSDFATAANLDASFHKQLVAATPNDPLRILAEQLIALARRPGVAVYEVPGAAENSVREHQQIVAALQQGDKRLSARLLRKHGRRGSQFALARVDDGSGEGGTSASRV